MMKRYDVPLGRRLTEVELQEIPFCEFDNNGQNAALDDNGRIVLIDYGNIDFYYVAKE